MKRLFKIILLSLMVAASSISAFACSDDGAGSGAGEKGLLYKMFSGDEYYTVYSYVKESDEDVVLDIGEFNKDGVRIGRIKAGAFKDNDNIVKIVVPDTVEKIDAGAFANMKALKEIVLPFIGKTAVADVYFNSADYSARENASVGKERNFGYIFGTEEYEGGVQCTQNYDENNTAAYYLPETLEKVSVVPAESGYGIPMYAFSGNAKVKEISLSENVTVIGDSAFKNNKYLKTVNLAGISVIYDNAFNGAKDVKAAELNSCTSIGNNAFSGCPALASVVVNCDIKADTFYNCSALKTLNVLEGVNTIGERAFYGCNAVTTINVSGDNLWTVNFFSKPLNAENLKENYNYVWER